MRDLWLLCFCEKLYLSLIFLKYISYYINKIIPKYKRYVSHSFFIFFPKFFIFYFYYLIRDDFYSILMFFYVYIYNLYIILYIHVRLYI